MFTSHSTLSHYFSFLMPFFSTYPSNILTTIMTISQPKIAPAKFLRQGPTVDGAQPSFENLLLARKNDYVDFTSGPASENDVYEIPIPGESLNRTCEKMLALADVVRSGRSVAVMTGFMDAISENKDSETIAWDGMTENERNQYTQWKEGKRLPAYDWKKCVESVGDRTDLVQRYERRAAAAREIWDNDTITKENIAWITTRNESILPLIIAVAKIHAANRNSETDQEYLMGAWSIEQQTIHRVLAIATENQNIAIAEVECYFRQVIPYIEVLQARKYAILAKYLEY